ncbi:HERC1 [Symbiodinium sp. KB8]|nr:HERC1 [Symbiodinium sp. KB8]
MQKPRLGWLMCILKVTTLVWSAVFLFWMRAYSNSVVPSGGSFLELWIEPAAEVSAADSSLTYCTDPARYDYNYSERFNYRMSGCEHLPFGESYVKGEATLFFPTSVDDTYVMTFGARKCFENVNASAAAEAELLCQQAGGTLFYLRSQTSSAGGIACECRRHRSFFAAVPEEQRFLLTHGFLASNMGVLGNDRMRGSTRFSSNQESSDGLSWNDMQDEGILTVIQDDQGRECLIGGSSRFQPQESRLGIGASIEEWLRCAGVDLEWTDPGISAGSAGPVARLTGLEMAIELEYRNTHNMNFKGVVCYARVRAMQRWNTRPVLHYDYSLSNGEESAYRARHQRGVEVRFAVQGKIDFLDLTLLTTALSNVLSLLTILPTLVISFIAVTFLGPLSNIFYAAMESNINVALDCRSMITRLMTSEAAFEELCNKQAACDSGKENKFTRGHMKQLMDEILRKEEELQDLEKDHIVEFLMEELQNEENSKLVDRMKYMKLHHAHDHVQLDDLVQLFDHDRQKGMLERIFRDDDFQQKKQQYQLKKDASEAGDLQRAQPARAESTRQQPMLSSSTIGKGEDVVHPEAGEASKKPTARASPEEVALAVAVAPAPPAKPARKRMWSAGHVGLLLAEQRDQDTE